MAVEQDSLIEIEVVYAYPEKTRLISLKVKAGTTAAQAIEQSGILAQCPDIDLNKNRIGIFSKLQETDVVLHNNDRVEIYRPLITDPKEARRRRAAVKHGQAKDK